MRSRLFPVVAAALALLSMSPARASGDDPGAMLSSAERSLTVMPLPPFVEYTLLVDASEDATDFGAREPQRYRVRLRTGDHAALVTEEDGYHEYRGLRYMRPTFYDGDIPSPFLLDVFRTAPEQATVEPFVASTLQSVARISEAYTMRSHTLQPNLGEQLVLVPRDGNRDKYRVQWLYVDPITYSIRAVRTYDSILESKSGRWLGNAAATVIPLTLNGVQVILQMDEYQIDDRGARVPGLEMHFRFGEYAFPSTLPDWYFDPRTYGAHAGKEEARK